MAFATVLAGMPDLLQRTLHEHVPDERGLCRECRARDGTAAFWPCLMRGLAEEAREMAGGDSTARHSAPRGMTH
jgi:hypothetical protein